MDYIIQGETLEGIANAIREKKGTTEKILPTNFASEVLAIETTEVIGTVNGKIVEQVVADGKTIRTGDFVELVNMGDYASIAGGDSGISSIVSDRLTDTKYILREYFGTTTNTAHLRVMDISSDGITVTDTITSYSGYRQTANTYICTMDEQHLCVLSRERPTSTSSDAEYIYLQYYTVNPDQTVKLEARIRIYSTNDEDYMLWPLHIARLDSSHILIAYEKDVATTSTILEVYEIIKNETTGVFSFSKISSTDLSTYVSRVRLIDPSTVLVGYSTSQGGLFNLKIFTISNYVVAPTEISYTFDDTVGYNPDVWKVKDNRYIIDRVNVEYINGEFVVGNVVDLSWSLTDYNTKSIGGNLMISWGSGSSYGVTLWNPDTGELLDKYPLPDTTTDTDFLINSSSTFYAYQYASGYIIPFSIKDNKLIPSESPTKAVQPATSTQFLYGVALEDGSSGDTIKIAIPSIVTPPEISLEADTLSITSTDNRTEEFAVFVDGEEQTTIEVQTMAITFDLSSLNLSAGTHEITVKARASGYADSVESNAVSYVMGAGSGGGTCFVAGTPVLMADGSTKAIENIVVGDEVLTWNEATKTYDTGVVIRLIRSETTDMAKVTFADGTSIEMTAMHPIYTQDGWKSLTGYNDLPILQVGDMALSVNGEYDEIVSIERWTAEKAVKVYNINVEDEHNYFAGETLILVHNKGSA